MRQAVEAVTGKDFKEFFNVCVSGAAPLPYNEYLKTVGLELKPHKALAPYAGFVAVRNFDEPAVVAAIDDNSEALRQGLAIGDVVLLVNGKPLGGNVEDRVASMRVGESIKLRVTGRDGQRDIKFKLGSREQEEFTITSVEVLTSDQRARRAAWLTADDQAPRDAPKGTVRAQSTAAASRPIWRRKGRRASVARAGAARLLGRSRHTCWPARHPWTFLSGKVDLLYRMGTWIGLAGVRLVGVKVEMVGTEKIDWQRTYIFMCNHVSNLDPPIVIPVMPRRTSVLVKKELFRVPILGGPCGSRSWFPWTAVTERLPSPACALPLSIYLYLRLRLAARCPETPRPTRYANPIWHRKLDDTLAFTGMLAASRSIWPAQRYRYGAQQSAWSACARVFRPWTSWRRDKCFLRAPLYHRG